ncbi:MAG: hypothetical protein K0S61_2475 [Anaerocolumna sp.]|jgi:hypothetical protein|nr:hypothetical protein [Anaerocolumna sp.]
MTFRANNAEELVSSENHDIILAYRYLTKEWVPEHKDIIIDLNNRFQFQNITLEGFVRLQFLKFIITK